jgi:hypothetical protein
VHTGIEGLGLVVDRVHTGFEGLGLVVCVLELKGHVKTLYWLKKMLSH